MMPLFDFAHVAVKPAGAVSAKRSRQDFAPRPTREPTVARHLARSNQPRQVSPPPGLSATEHSEAWAATASPAVFADLYRSETVGLLRRLARDTRGALAPRVDLPLHRATVKKILHLALRRKNGGHSIIEAQVAYGPKLFRKPLTDVGDSVQRVSIGVRVDGSITVLPATGWQEISAKSFSARESIPEPWEACFKVASFGDLFVKIWIKPFPSPETPSQSYGRFASR